MTSQLSDQLAQIADRTPPLPVADDLWRRGRRLRRRDRLSVVLAVACLAAVAGGLGLAVTGSRNDAAPAGTRDDGAVPSVVYDVPQRLVTQDDPSDGGLGESVWDDRVVETDLAIGRASVAFTVGEEGRLPLVVTAVDGGHHYLDLPGWTGGNTINAIMSLGGPPLALSPDGRQLAYSWWDPEAPLDQPMPAGVRVVDLESGDLRTIALAGGNGVVVDSLGWSPDSRWLVWRGNETKSWTPANRGDGAVASGRIAPDAATSEPIALDQGGGSDLALSVSDGGQVSVVRQGGQWLLWDGRIVAQGETGTRNVSSRSAFSPSGTSVALGTFDPRESLTFVEPATGSLTERPLAKGLGLYPDGAVVQPLGWIDDSLVVALVTPAGDTDGSTTYGGPHLAVMTAPSKPESAWTYRTVARVERGATGSLTVAVDLMSLEEPVRDFPEPDWPWSDERKVAVGVLTGVGVLVLGFLVLTWWRRSRVRRVRRASAG